MGQLVKLTLISRNGRSIPSASTSAAFDIDDIVTPITSNGVTSYFSARMMKGTVAGSSRNQSKGDYVVSQTLSQIAALSSKFLILTVSQRKATNINSKTYVFNSSRISEGIYLGKPNTLDPAGPKGSMFYYCEDGDPLPVQYYVNETIDQIITQDTTYIPSVPAAAPTIISYNLTGSTNMNLTGNSGEIIVNVTSTNPTETLNTFTNFSNVTKITLRPANGLTLTANSDATAGGVAGDMRLNAASLVILGSFSGYLELTKRTVATIATGFYQTDYIDQYTSL